MAGQGTKSGSKPTVYTDQTYELPFGKSAEDFFNLNGWGNGKTVQPNQGHGIALPLHYFGGGDKLLPNEKRPFYMSSKAQEGEADTVWVHYFDDISLTPEFVRDAGVVLFDGNPSKSSMYNAWFGGNEIDLDFADKKSPQMFFAQRVIPSRFASQDDFIKASISVLTEPMAVHALLARRDISFSKSRFLAQLLPSYKEKFDVWESVVNGDRFFPRFFISVDDIPHLVEEIVPENSNENTFALFVDDAAQLIKNFCLERTVSKKGKVISDGEVSQEALAKGFGWIIRGFSGHDHNPGAIYKAVPKIREHCGEACDDDIVSMLQSRAYDIYGYGYQSFIPEMESVVALLSVEAQEKFYADMFTEAQRVLSKAEPSVIRSDRHRSEKLAPLVFAVRGAGNGLVLDDSAREKLIYLLDSPEELAFALSTNPDIEFVASLLAQKADGSMGPRDFYFLYGEEDWTHGTADEEYRARVGLEFAKQYSERLQARNLVDADKAPEDYTRTQKREFEVKQFVDQLGSERTGISAFIGQYGRSLGAHKELHKETIDFLFVNGNANDHLSLARYGCLDDKIADRVRKSYGDQLYGEDSRKALEGFADVLADDTDFGTARMEEYLEDLVRARREPNGDPYRKTRLSRPGTPKFEADPRPIELPAPARTLELN